MFQILDSTGGALRGWQRFAQVLERTAKTPGMGSPTAARLQLEESMSGGMPAAIAGMGAAAVLSSLGTPGAAGAGYLGASMTQRFLHRQAVKMGQRSIAKALTAPDSIKKLRALARKDPRSPAAAASAMALLGRPEEEEE
jgi:hypothetical protein